MLLVDDEGDEFPDLGEVCRHALEVASELAREYPRLPAHRSTIVPLALEVMDEGKPRLLDFGVSDEQAWEVGLACGGKVQVFVERLS